MNHSQAITKSTQKSSPYAKTKIKNEEGSRQVSEVPMHAREIRSVREVSNHNYQF